jgi:hypothetical protein
MIAVQPIARHDTSVRDDAYAKILHQTLAQRDFEYACELGGKMTGTEAKDIMPAGNG